MSRIFRRISSSYLRSFTHRNCTASALPDKIPVTVLSGFLGSGKTTLLNHALSNNSGLKIATIVNDMSEINIDSTLINQGSFNRIDEELIELSNGCICCTLRQDLIDGIIKLNNYGKFDYVLIESTGISEPLPVAQTFALNDELNNIAKLDTLITVVDCKNILNYINSAEYLVDMKMNASDKDNRPLSKLIMDQIEFANVILLNKIDLINKMELEKVKSLLNILNPKARIVESIQSRIDLNSVFNTGLYDENEYNTTESWDKEMERYFENSHVPETEQYGINSFSFINNDGIPFHSERLRQLLWNDGDMFKGVLRSKGYFWISCEPDTRFDINIVGPMCELIVNTVWLESGLKMLLDPNNRNQIIQYSKENGVSDEELQQQLKNRQEIIRDMMNRLDILKNKGKLHDKVGDRRIEMVFIGDNTMNKDKILNALNDSLMTNDEINMGINYWSQQPNPFQNVPRCIVI